MKFRMGETWMTLRGDQGLNKSAVSLREMVKALLKEGQGLWVEMEQPAECGALMGKEEEIPEGVSKLIRQHKQVFTETRRLPPARGLDHAITLKAGTHPINVRPFRYPHFQKNEIERLVKEMLAARIIQPSISPFSSPVL